MARISRAQQQIAIARLAEGVLGPALELAFTDAVAALSGSATAKALQAAIETGSEAQILAVLDIEAFEAAMDAAIRQQTAAGLQGGAQISVNHLPQFASGAFVYNPTAPNVLEFLNTAGRDFVKNVTAETQSQIRATIVRGFETSKPPLQLANDIKNLVGLTARDANAVSNFELAMFENGAPKKERDARVAAQIRKFKRLRAENIARTEMLTAANQGRLEGWRQLVDQGVIDGIASKKVWYTALDERVCPICQPLHNKTVGIEGEFNFQITNKQGATRSAGFDTGVAPPAHNQCRCTLILEPVRA